MDKISTQSPVLIKESVPRPANETLAKIRQFARVYTSVAITNRSLGNLVLN